VFVNSGNIGQTNSVSTATYHPWGIFGIAGAEGAFCDIEDLMIAMF
jgi:hypothetical protein